MIKFFKFLVPGLAASLIGLLNLPAQASAVAPPPPLFSTLFFIGNCEDCAAALHRPDYAVTARLVLQNYFQGSLISPTNFVSFSYNGSNLLDPYSILSSSSPLTVSGNISFAMPGANEFHVTGVNLTGVNRYFDLFIGGRWDTGVPPRRTADNGGSGTFGPNAVPEPATMLLMGAALAAAGLARRRRQR